jgi:hypothetical protein
MTPFPVSVRPFTEPGLFAKRYPQVPPLEDEKMGLGPQSPETGLPSHRRPPGDNRIGAVFATAVTTLLGTLLPRGSSNISPRAVATVPLPSR